MHNVQNSAGLPGPPHSLSIYVALLFFAAQLLLYILVHPGTIIRISSTPCHSYDGPAKLTSRGSQHMKDYHCWRPRLAYY
jgi:hypothetical protein